jgi:hypothetical protein
MEIKGKVLITLLFFLDNMPTNSIGKITSNNVNNN